jgi:hypothetical protein
MGRPRSIPVDQLAFAYELRQEYGIRWKVIARELRLDHNKLRGAVNQAVALGVNPWRT